MSLHPLRSSIFGLVLGFLLAGCGGSSDGGSLLPKSGTDFSDLRPYDTSAEYADVMVDCATAEEPEDSCTLSTLPLIGMETEAPTTADIMSRVLVSHDWMAERFEQALNSLPADIRLLLRATTAIVIDDDIRPAYYTAVTGAIYLDPGYLWLTSAELATINPQADFRSGFSDPLQFRSLSRYVKNGNYAYPYGLLEPNPGKTIEDVEFLISQLLYHELAHANDFMPPDSWGLLDRNDTVYQAILDNEANFVATRLYNTDPLLSDELLSLGSVMYHGETPTSADLAITATEVGELFELDGANDHYAYSSIFEDSAMLFEEAMMKYHFDIDRDIAFTEVPPDPAYCDGYTIGWGMRNRIGETDVKARAQFVTGEILPSADLSMFFQELEIPQPMTPGANWCDTLTMNASFSQGLQKSVPQMLPLRDLRVPQEQHLHLK